jgi:hypothetical protein
MTKQTHSSPRITVGMVLMSIAVLHEVVGVAMGLGLDPNVRFEGLAPLQAMARAGLFASVGTDPWRNAITWFLLWGFLLGLLGIVMHQAERAGIKPSRSFAFTFGAMCIAGVVLMPASGFWLGIVPVWLALSRGSQRA